MILRANLKMVSLIRRQIVRLHLMILSMVGRSQAMFGTMQTISIRMKMSKTQLKTLKSLIKTSLRLIEGASWGCKGYSLTQTLLILTQV